jgi:hypothetical protein
MYDKSTVFLAGKTKVSPGVLRKGMPAAVAYREERGHEIISGVVAVFRWATEVRFDASAFTEKVMSERFVDNNDGTISDTEGHLMWQKGDSKKEMSHKAAQRYCDALKLRGYADWRLPRKEEGGSGIALELLMPKRSQDSPADWYWSADPMVLMPFNTRRSLSNAVVIPDDKNLAYARCVRAM